MEKVPSFILCIWDNCDKIACEGKKEINKSYVVYTYILAFFINVFFV